jgi:predicted Zn-dependent peptidase
MEDEVDPMRPVPFFFLVTIPLVSAMARAAPPALQLPVEEHRLPNGLRVVLAPDPQADDVSVLVRYDVGSADDPPGREGFAHLVEHLMFRGSKHVRDGDHAALVQRAGGYGMNATTELDATHYYETVPPEQLALVLWLESDRMGFLAQGINQRHLDAEREIVRDEMRGRMVDTANARVGEATMNEVFPPWHPYHRVYDGEALSGVKTDDVLAFLATWYTPRNATVALAGRFDAASALALASRYFGDLPGDSPPMRAPLPAQWRTPDVRLDMGAGVSADTVELAFATPPYGTAADAALDVLATLLTNRTGPLYRALVGTGLATGVSARQSSHRRGSIFSITAAVSDGGSLEAVETAIERVLTDLSAGVSAADCEREREAVRTSLFLRLETTAARAGALARAPSLSAPWDDARYAALQPSDIAAALRTLLVPENRVALFVHHGTRYPVRGIGLQRQERLR